MLSTLLFFWFVRTHALSASTALNQHRVVVTGATGRLGRLVVKELLERNSTMVTAVVRDRAKARKVLPLPDSRLVLAPKVDLTNPQDVKDLVQDADCVVWCATGFSDASSPIQKLRALLGLVSGESFDVKALRLLAESVRETESCRVVCCSSAAVTRPVSAHSKFMMALSAFSHLFQAWPEEKKDRYKGASDIPIVRLNPLNILDVKRAAEDELRCSEGRYTIVRPTGLNDDWPQGRVILSQGDLAVGRISRLDVAATLAALAVDVPPDLSKGKTFECFSIAGYQAPRSLNAQLERLTVDSDPQHDSQMALDATYAILQQLVPGESLRPQDLAMGQTYEQLDVGETGRLGERGKENVPTFVRT